MLCLTGFFALVPAGVMRRRKVAIVRIVLGGDVQVLKS